MLTVKQNNNLYKHLIYIYKINIAIYIIKK